MIVLLDLDDTILDFKKAERVAVGKTLSSFGILPTPNILDRYHEINRMMWEKLEKREVSREEVLVGRFSILFSELGVVADAEAVRNAYEDNLSEGHFFIDGAEQLLNELRKAGHRLFLVSNGTTKVQKGRMESAKINRFFESIFLSEEIGAVKPNPAFFHSVFSKIVGVNLSETVLIGDSLSSDILGGEKMGIKTVWFNPEKLPLPREPHPDFTVSTLAEIPMILKKIG